MALGRAICVDADDDKAWITLGGDGSRLADKLAAVVTEFLRVLTAGKFFAISFELIVFILSHADLDKARFTFEVGGGADFFTGAGVVAEENLISFARRGSGAGDFARFGVNDVAARSAAFEEGAVIYTLGIDTGADLVGAADGRFGVEVERSAVGEITHFDGAVGSMVRAFVPFTADIDAKVLSANGRRRRGDAKISFHFDDEANAARIGGAAGISAKKVASRFKSASGGGVISGANSTLVVDEERIVSRARDEITHGINNGSRRGMKLSACDASEFGIRSE